MYCTYKYVFSPYKPMYRIHTCTYICIHLQHLVCTISSKTVATFTRNTIDSHAYVALFYPCRCPTKGCTCCSPATEASAYPSHRPCCQHHSCPTSWCAPWWQQSSTDAIITTLPRHDALPRCPPVTKPASSIPCSEYAATTILYVHTCSIPRAKARNSSLLDM